jgi:hypothetical protein
MDFETVKELFVRHMNKKTKICRLKGILGFVLCPVVLAVAVACVYGLLWIFTYKRYGPDNEATCLWIALGSLPIMFIGNLLTPREESLMEKRMREGAPMAHGIANKGTVLFHVFLWVMFTGPRLCNWATASMREGRQWQEMDAHGCAAVLSLLVRHPKKVPYEDIKTEIPWLDLPVVLSQITRVPGVLQLQSPPAGLSLTDDLRKAIRAGGPIE